MSRWAHLLIVCVVLLTAVVLTVDAVVSIASGIYLNLGSGVWLALARDTHDGIFYRPLWNGTEYRRDALLSDTVRRDCDADARRDPGRRRRRDREPGGTRRDGRGSGGSVEAAVGLASARDAGRGPGSRSLFRAPDRVRRAVRADRGSVRDLRPRRSCAGGEASRIPSHASSSRPPCSSAPSSRRSRACTGLLRPCSRCSSQDGDRPRQGWPG